MISKGKIPPMSLFEQNQFLDTQLTHIGDLLKDFLETAVRKAWQDGIEGSLRIYEKAFEDNWTVQDTIDAIKRTKGELR